MIPAVHPVVGAGQVVGFYIPIHFKAPELVPKSVIDSQPEWKIWMLFDSRILWTIDKIRELYNSPMKVNDWTSGGSFTLRGWRPFDSNITPGILVDQHKLGRAIDFNISGIDPAVFIKDVLDNPNQMEFQFITGLEISPTWNHVDCRNFDKKTNGGKPMTFNA
jgi:hypothetical protein